MIDTYSRSFAARLSSRRHVLRGLAASSALLAASGCTRVLSEIAALGSDVDVKEDLSYGSHARQKLDLYLGKDHGSETPVILFLYGGSWKWGSRSRYGFVGHALASRGFAVAVADYRLYPEVRFPAFNFDGASAIVWLQDNRKSLGLGRGPVHLMGHSAGAHIAALLALDPTYLGRSGLGSDQIASVTGLAGPYGMYPSKVDFISGIFPPADQEDKARPVSFVRADAPPMLLLHGAGDSLVAPRNSTLMAQLLTAQGATARARVYETIGHKEIIAALAPPFRGLAPVLDDVTAFINSVA